MKSTSRRYSSCIRLWSNKGDLVLDPMAGIGSTGHVALEHSRRFLGIELKPEYWQVAVNNLQYAKAQQDLFAYSNERTIP